MIDFNLNYSQNAGMQKQKINLFQSTCIYLFTYPKRGVSVKSGGQGLKFNPSAFFNFVH